MGLDRGQLKIDILEELGLKADDRVESLMAETHRLEGAAKAFDTGREKVEKDVFARFKKDIDEGKVPQDPNEAVDRYLRTCIHYFTHLATQSKSQVLVMQGRVQEATETVSRYKSLQSEERLKINAAQAALVAGTVKTNEEGDLEVVPQEGRPAPRPAGVHPGPSLKALRLAEEQALAAQQEAPEASQVSQEPVEVGAPEQSVEEPQEPAPMASPAEEEPDREVGMRGRRRRVKDS